MDNYINTIIIKHILDYWQDRHDSLLNRQYIDNNRSELSASELKESHERATQINHSVKILAYLRQQYAIEIKKITNTYLQDAGFQI
jgi:hypothetical protein